VTCGAGSRHIRPITIAIERQPLGAPAARSESGSGRSPFLARTGLDPATLKLEITESVVVTDTTVNCDTLANLRALGIRLAIDDFGTGNSAMEYLLRLPVDTLKIDRSFIANLGRDERATALVCGIIGLAKSLGLHVNGEGVDAVVLCTQLQALGCDVG
jgi:EAL domain-containing protein (putative c-di-GMP-specific phosphodiesterase class I)